MKKKHLVVGVVAGLFVIGALLILKQKKDDCMCEKGWECCCCGY